MMREIGLLWRDRGLRILALLYAFLLAFGSTQGIGSYRKTVSRIQQAQQEYEQKWMAMARSAAADRQTWGSWKSASLAGGELGGAVAWLDPLPTGVLNLGHAARENPVRRISLYDSPASPPLENPMNGLYGAMDLGFVVLWLLPLMALLMAYQTLGRDWEAGVWSLILVSGVSLYRLALSRLVLPLGILLVSTLAAACVSIALTSGRLDGAFFAWAVSVSLYAVIWIALGGWLGLGARNPSRQLLIAGALWLGSMWVGPGFVDAVTELAVPRVSPAGSLLAARDAQISSARRGAVIMQRVYQEHPDWQPSPTLIEQMNRPVPGGPRKRDARNVYSNYLAAAEAAGPSRDRIVGRRRQVEEMARRFSIASPLVAMQYLTEEVAGNSFDRFREFEGRAEMFLVEWRAYFAEKVWRLEEMETKDIERRPRFRVVARPEEATAARIAMPLGALVLWASGTSLALIWRIRNFFRA